MSAACVKVVFWPPHSTVCCDVMLLLRTYIPSIYIYYVYLASLCCSHFPASLYSFPNDLVNLQVVHLPLMQREWPLLIYAKYVFWSWISEIVIKNWPDNNLISSIRYHWNTNPTIFNSQCLWDGLIVQQPSQNILQQYILVQTVAASRHMLRRKKWGISIKCTHTYS